MNLDRWCLSRTRLAQAIVWGLAVATVVSCAAAGVFAQIDFTFAPMVANLEVSPGGTGVFEAAVKNESTAKTGEFVVRRGRYSASQWRYGLGERGTRLTPVPVDQAVSDRLSVGPGQWAKSMPRAGAQEGHMVEDTLSWCSSWCLTAIKA